MERPQLTDGRMSDWQITLDELLEAEQQASADAQTREEMNLFALYPDWEDNLVA